MPELFPSFFESVIFNYFYRTMICTTLFVVVVFADKEGIEEMLRRNGVIMIGGKCWNFLPDGCIESGGAIGINLTSKMQ